MRAFTLLTIFLVGCGNVSTTSSDNHADAAPASAASSLVGVYHHAQVDATNLDLRDDGTFVWTIAGCDFGGGGCGTWTDDGRGLTLTSSGGKPLMWSHDGSFQFAIDWAVVTKTDTGVSVTARPADGSADFTDTWSTGRVCPICTSGGPSGQKSCDAALPDAVACQ